jgi:hypothetical protein
MPGRISDISRSILSSFTLKDPECGKYDYHKSQERTARGIVIAGKDHHSPTKGCSDHRKYGQQDGCKPMTSLVHNSTPHI